MDPVRFIWKWGGNATMLAAIIWALWRGDKPVRIGAMILAVAWALTTAVHKPGVYTPEPMIIAVDCVTTVAFIWLSLWSRRLWTLFISAFALCTVASHFAAIVAPKIGGFSYVTAITLWGGHGLTLALAAGVWGAEQRRREASQAAGIHRQ